MLEVIRQDYIRTARAKGQRERIIITKHALRNALIPVVTSIGSTIGSQLGGILPIESVFAIPGIGKYMVDAISMRNFPAIQGGVVVLAVLFTFINLLIDIVYTIGCSFYAIISQEAMEANGGVEASVRAPMGTGKYFLKDWVDGQYAVFERNDNYWDKDNLPYYKYIQYNFLGDTASRLMSLQSGDSKVLIGSAADQLDTLNANANLKPVVTVQDGTYVLWLNCQESAVLKDAAVRKAIALAVDPDAFLLAINGGHGGTTASMFATVSPLYKLPAGYQRTLDIEQAKKILADAGYKDGDIKLSALCSSAGPGIMQHEMLQAMLAKIGITINVDAFEMATYISMLRNGEYDVNIGMTDSFRPRNVMDKMDGRVSAATAQGGARASDEELYRLIDACKVAAPGQATLDAYAALQAYNLEKNFGIGLVTSIRIDAHHSSVTGLTYDLRGFPNLSTVRAS